MKDVVDVLDVASHADMLGYADEIECMISSIRCRGWELAQGKQRMVETSSGLETEVFHLALVPAASAIPRLAVPRRQ